MSNDTASAATVGTRRGFVLLIDTVCDGVVPAEWDANGRVILYESRETAEAERVDWIALRRETRHPESDPLDDDDGAWIEPAIEHTNGALTLLDSKCTLTSAQLLAARA